MENVKFDAGVMHNQPRMAAEERMPDDGSGKVEVGWRGIPELFLLMNSKLCTFRFTLKMESRKTQLQQPIYSNEFSPLTGLPYRE